MLKKGLRLLCKSGNPYLQAVDHYQCRKLKVTNPSDSGLTELRTLLAKTDDSERIQAREKRHARGYRTARENLIDLVDEESFLEYGQLAVAAQRSRKSKEELQTETAADGIIAGIATINSAVIQNASCKVGILINDYTVLAGTQGFYHHQKLDRICEIARNQKLPIVMFTEGGGGRPGDIDVNTQVAGLNVPSFARWAALESIVPRIAVNNGFCFAGNAALFGAADIRIATKDSYIGMAGPAMIEGGGLGIHSPKEIGPSSEQERNGVIDIVVQDEQEGTCLAQILLSYFQGVTVKWASSDQESLRRFLPEDRRWGYQVRQIIETLGDQGSFIELQRVFGRSVIVGFMRLEGRPIGVLANDCQQLGGAIDSEAADKAARFFNLCGSFNIPILSLVDTPGFMVGPDSEKQGAVVRMSNLFSAGAKFSSPLVAIFLRKGYGLGAMAMVGGGFAQPVFAAAWPNGEFGAMGLEGAVKLGFKKELDETPDKKSRDALFDELVSKMYQAGSAFEVASKLEIDAVIDPADTRDRVISAFNSAISHY